MAARKRPIIDPPAPIQSPAEAALVGLAQQAETPEQVAELQRELQRRAFRAAWINGGLQAGFAETAWQVALTTDLVGEPFDPEEAARRVAVARPDLAVPLASLGR